MDEVDPNVMRRYLGRFYFWLLALGVFGVLFVFFVLLLRSGSDLTVVAICTVGFAGGVWIGLRKIYSVQNQAFAYAKGVVVEGYVSERKFGGYNKSTHQQQYRYTFSYKVDGTTYKLKKYGYNKSYHPNLMVGYKYHVIYARDHPQFACLYERDNFDDLCLSTDKKIYGWPD